MTKGSISFGTSFILPTDYSCLSVNDGIQKEYTAVSYAGIDDAIALIKHLSHDCLMAKTDVKSAFRILLVHCQD